MNKNRGYDAFVAAIREAKAKHPQLVLTKQDGELIHDAVLYLHGWPVAEERMRRRAILLDARDCEVLALCCEAATLLGLDPLIAPVRLEKLQAIVERAQDRLEVLVQPVTIP